MRDYEKNVNGNGGKFSSARGENCSYNDRKRRKTASKSARLQKKKMT